MEEPNIIVLVILTLIAGLFPLYGVWMINNTRARLIRRDAAEAGMSPEEYEMHRYGYISNAWLF